MDFVRGQVVKSLAGRDKRNLFVVLHCDGKCVIIADGVLRRLEKPKKKNSKHLAVTNIVLPSETLENNKKIHNALRQCSASESSSV